MYKERVEFIWGSKALPSVDQKEPVMAATNKIENRFLKPEKHYPRLTVWGPGMMCFMFLSMECVHQGDCFSYCFFSNNCLLSLPKNCWVRHDTLFAPYCNFQIITFPPCGRNGLLQGSPVSYSLVSSIANDFHSWPWSSKIYHHLGWVGHLLEWPIWSSVIPSPWPLLLLFHACHLFPPLPPSHPGLCPQQEWFHLWNQASSFQSYLPPAQVDVYTAVWWSV